MRKYKFYSITVIIIITLLIGFYKIHKHGLVTSSDVIDMAQMAQCSQTHHKSCSWLLPLFHIDQTPWVAWDLWPNVHRFPGLPWLYENISQVTHTPITTYLPLIFSSFLGYIFYVVFLSLILTKVGTHPIGLLWGLGHPAVIAEAFSGNTTVWDVMSITAQMFFLFEFLNPALQRKKLLISVAGFLAGFAFLIRYNSILWTAPFALAYGVVTPKKDKFFYTMLWTVSALIPVVPWCVHLWRLTGNPLYSLTAEITKHVIPGQDGYPWFMFSLPELSKHDLVYKAGAALQTMLISTSKLFFAAKHALLLSVSLLFYAVTFYLFFQNHRKQKILYKPLLMAAYGGCLLLHVVLLFLDYAPRYSQPVIPVIALSLHTLWNQPFVSQRNKNLGFALLAILLLGNLWGWQQQLRQINLNNFCFKSQELNQLKELSQDPHMFIISSHPANAALQFQKKTLPLPAYPQDLFKLLSLAQNQSYKKIFITLFWPSLDWFRYGRTPEEAKITLSKIIARSAWKISKIFTDHSSSLQNSVERPFIAITLEKP